MPWFRADLCGRNFQLELNQPEARFSIAAEVCLWADSACEAEDAALALFRGLPDLVNRIHNPQSDPPILYGQATELNEPPADFGNFSPLRIEKEPELTAALDFEDLFDDEDSD